MWRVAEKESMPLFLVSIIDLWRALCSGFCWNSSAARLQFCWVANSGSCNSQYLHLESTKTGMRWSTDVKQWVFLNCACSRNINLSKYLIMLNSARSQNLHKIGLQCFTYSGWQNCLQRIRWLDWLVWHIGYLCRTPHTEVCVTALLTPPGISSTCLFALKRQWLLYINYRIRPHTSFGS